MTARHHATLLHVRVVGELDVAGVAPVEQAVAAEIDALTDSVVFDLRGVTFLDLAGVAMLLRARDRAQAASIELGVVAPAGAVRRALINSGSDTPFAFLSEPPARDE